MKILLYNPDNEVTNNFMPHLWMFLLKSLTPPGHEVVLVDGNAQRMSAPELVEYARGHAIGLTGIGFMTRMAAKAYRMADALRAAGIPVVMGGPHVTEVPGEPLGRDGGPRHTDAVALGEADQIWPRIVADAANGTLQEVYAPVGDNGKEIKPSLSNYPEIPWDQMDLSQFNLLNRVPRLAVRCLRRLGMTWKVFTSFRLSRGAAARTAANSARSPDFLEIPSAFGRTIASSGNSCCSNVSRNDSKARSRSSSSTTTSPLTASGRNRCCGISSPPAPSFPGWHRSA
jgi:hypothetical protein